MKWPECIIELPHIVADPCKPRWVVRCSHGKWFWNTTSPWKNKRDEQAAYVALWGLLEKVKIHVGYDAWGVSLHK